MKLIPPEFPYTMKKVLEITLAAGSTLVALLGIILFIPTLGWSWYLARWLLNRDIPEWFYRKD